MVSAALRLQVGARTIATIPRRLERVALSLDDALAARQPVFPAMPRGADGYLVTSLPLTVDPAWTGLTFERQRYVRRYVDLSAGEVAWRAALSGQVRSVMKRKARRLAEANGGTLDIRRYRSAEDLAACHPVARALAARTYQERLLGGALPADFDVLAEAAGSDRVRAWMLFLGERAIAYLWCGAEGAALRYDFVGHDPDHAALSPGGVLMEAAITDLFADRFSRFDFTEGDGQHKRQMATGGVECRDLLLLRPTIANRAALTLVGGFDAGVAWAKRSPALTRMARHIRR